MRNLKKGDLVTRIMPPTMPNHGDDRPCKAWVNSGIVVDVDENHIICYILVDTPRAMKFHRKTGLCATDIEHLKNSFIIEGTLTHK